MAPKEDPEEGNPTQALHAYYRRRSAERTPEPFGRPGAIRPQVFVVHKHAARRLHYDLRLEHGGVLWSWAVPRGFALDPAEKRLAVRTEDHPVEYADFEGVIPPGNYGAGAMIVWDRGRWSPLEDPAAGLEKGKLLFELHGHKLRGVWTLVRTKGGKQTEWLLIKKPDAWARPETVLDDRSILSGLTVDELPNPHTVTARVREEALALGAASGAVSLGSIEPMLAETTLEAFSSPQWLFELKYDGFRLLMERAPGAQGRLAFRSGRVATGAFPEIARALSALPYEHLVLDSEVCVLDAQARPSFQRLQARAHLVQARDIEAATVALPAVAFVFDLLALEDLDLRRLRLAERKRLLTRILPAVGPLRLADHVDTLGEALFAEVRKQGLEGLMAKRKDAPYVAGRSAAWVKIVADLVGDFVVVGMAPPEGARTGFRALELAVWEGEGLVYAGRVGTGFDEATLRAVSTELEARRLPEPPCGCTPPETRKSLWCAPEPIVEVRFKQWTAEGMLRLPVFLRFRDDKRPEECVRVGSAGDFAEPTLAPEVAPVRVREVGFSNLDKVFWPDEGTTKGDLVAYYRAIAPWLLPYLRDRPLVLTRYPDGIYGKSFFQKDAPAFTPGWVRTERLHGEHADREIDYFVADDLETLLFLANLASIPLHVWSSRIGSLARPDWCVLDLDPKEAPFEHVVTIARALHELGQAVGLPTYPKTSGSTGIHVMVPLGGQLSYVQCRMLAMLLARVVEVRLPAIATTARSLAARGGRVYLDTLQNGHGRLIVSPYSVRPRPGATVSAPLTWDEVRETLRPTDFTLRTLPERLARHPEDTLLPVLTEAPDLRAVLDRLQGLLVKK